MDPQPLDLLAAEHDVIVFDTIGVGYRNGRPRDSVEGLADGATEFVESLGLTRVDLLGWTLGGTVAQQVVLRRPDLVGKLIVAAADPNGQIPGAPPPNENVRRVMTKPEITADDMVYLFFPDTDTDTGRAAGHARVATRLAH